MTDRKRAAAYVRFSLVRRGPVPKQMAALLAMAREMGYTLGEDDIFVDRGAGEDLGERPGWTALQAAVLRNRDGDAPFACVLVESSTRVTRDVDSLKAARRRLRAAGAPIRSRRERQR